MNCPACKSERNLEAREAAPRIEEGFLVCIDCGCMFADFRAEWRQQSLQDIWLSIEVRKKREAKGGGG